MKSIRKAFYLLPVLVVALCMAVFAACNKGKTYTLTLDLDGGTLSVTELELEEGDNIADAVKDLVPQKSGLTFGAWFDGNAELAPEKTMPAEPVTLTAKYKVGYSVEIYLGNATVPDAAHSYAGSDYVGAAVAITPPAISGYVYNALHAGTVAGLQALSATASENVIKLYYTVSTSSAVIVYDGNAPDENTVRGSVSSTYPDANGGMTVAENGFSVEGYRFLGWAESSRGDVAYQPGEIIDDNSPHILYAKWQRGYMDRFGSTSYIFIPEEGGDKALLSRGMMEFEGTMSADGTVTFTLPNESTLEGKVFDDYTYAFKNTELAHIYIYKSAYLNPETGSTANPAVETDTLAVDVYGNATHRYNDEDGRAHAEKGVVMLLGSVIGMDGEVSFAEYLFLCTDNENGSFTFQTSSSGSQYYYKSSIGEGNRYSEFLSGDGSSGNLGEGGLMLDGYGNITFYDVFEGHYYVDRAYQLTALDGSTLVAYKIYAVLTDVQNQARDLLGYNVDENGQFIMRFYTLPFDEETSVYIEPKAEFGEYHLESNEDVTLVLDGNRAFPDSAIYTEGDTEQYGYYDVYATPRGEFFIDVTLYDMEHHQLVTPETIIRYKINLTEKTFAVAKEENHIEYVQLNPDSQNFDYAMTLALYDEAVTVDGVTGAKKAELLLQKEDDRLDYSVGATGYYTERGLKGGNVTLGTFVATGDLANDAVPTSITFMLSSAYDSGYFTRELYYVFAFTYGTGDGARTVKNYTELTDVNESGNTGDAENPKNTIWYVNLPVSGIGTVYFDGNGDATLGSFSIDRSGLRTRSIFCTYGYFLYVEGAGSSQSVEELCFGLTANREGAFTYYELLEEEEYAVFEYEGLGSLNNATHLVLRGNEAYWSENGFDEARDDKVLCTLVEDGTTASGATVYNLVPEDGAAPSGMPTRIALREIDYYDMVEWVRVTVFTRYNSSFDKTYTSGSETLEADGFGSATYTNARGPVNGEYVLQENNRLLFEADDGSHLYFSLSGNTFELLDGIAGILPIVIKGQWYYLDFDGHGNITIRSGTGMSSALYAGQGMYTVLDAETREVEMHLRFKGSSEVNTYVAAWSEGTGMLVLCDENARGVFVGEDWSVLYLNGFDSGSYYAADGSAGVTVYYDVVDTNDGFVALRTENYEYINFKLDAKNHTLVRPETYTAQQSFYDSKFCPLIFDDGGYLYYADEQADRTGYYYIDGDNLVLYVDMGDANTVYYQKITARKPAEGGDCVVNGNTYYAWTRGESVTFSGTVAIEGDSDTEHTLSLTFTPDGEARFYANATLTIDDKPYSGYQVVNSYMVGDTRYGLALYNPVIYEYSPFGTYTYNPKEGNTITVTGGTVNTKMYDGFESDLPEEQRSFIEETYIGFGPIRITATTASGTLRMGAETITFTDAKIEEVLYSDASMGPRYSAIFEHNGQDYVVQYHKYDGDYWLYMVATYEVVSANDGYKVGIASFYYADEGYTFPNWVKKGTPYAYTLYEASGEVVYAYNALVNADGTSGWVLALGNYNVSEDSGNLGKLYEIEVTSGSEKTATVTEHDVKQALGTFESGACFANFFVDGNTVELASFAVTDSDGDYAFIAVTSIESAGKNVWKVHAQDGSIYSISLLTEQDGSYTAQGEYWQINVTRDA